MKRLESSLGYSRSLELPVAPTARKALVSLLLSLQL